MNKVFGLLLTLIVGLFFLIGGLISKKVQNKDKLNIFSIALAFIVMLDLILVDLFPEIIELLEDYNYFTKILIIILFVSIGIGLLKILDFFIPDHHHEHHDDEKNHEEHVSHVKHIGILTVISLIFHNVLEGFSIFGISSDIKAGLLMTLSVALHNIPLGTSIFSSMSVKNNKLLIIILALSSLIGGIIYLIIGEISILLEAIIMCITLGMIIYIAIFELLPELIHNIKKKEAIFGILVGIIILVISLFV